MPISCGPRDQRGGHHRRGPAGEEGGLDGSQTPREAPERPGRPRPGAARHRPRLGDDPAEDLGDPEGGVDGVGRGLVAGDRGAVDEGPVVRVVVAPPPDRGRRGQPLVAAGSATGRRRPPAAAAAPTPA